MTWLTFAASALGLAAGGRGPRGGTMLTNVQWHPNGQALAINDTGGGRVAFFRLRPSVRPALAPWGAPVPSGSDPFVGRFTPDGRFYLTSEWGRDLAAADLDRRIPRAAGKLGVIRLGDEGGHQRIGAIDTGHSPEGLAISPDGRLIATVNMRGTVFPPGSATRPGSSCRCRAQRRSWPLWPCEPLRRSTGRTSSAI